jgi:hypothetical protein
MTLIPGIHFPVNHEEPGCRHVQGPLDQPPRNPVRGGGLGGGAAGINDSGDEHVPQPAGGTGPARDLDGGFEEGPAGHSGSSQKYRRLDQMTSTGPATARSRTRWRRRECRRVAITPQSRQPD